MLNKINPAAPVKDIPSQEKNKTTRNELRNILLILLAALGLRLFFFFEIKNTPIFTALFSDPLIFVNLAEEMVKYNGWFGGIVFYMSPGYTYFLAVIYALFDQDFILARLVQILVNCGNIFLIYKISKALFTVRIAYAAAITGAVYSVFIFYSSIILLEVLFAFFISLLIFNLLRNAGENKLYWLTSGIILGIAALFRGNILLFFPVIVLWIYFKYRDASKIKLLNAAAMLFLGVTIPVLPVTINNYLAEKEFVLLTSNAGINFFIGNHEEATGIYKVPDNIDLSLDPTGTKYAESAAGKNLTSSGVSSFWFDKGYSYIKSNPADALLLTAKKLFLFFDDDENPQSTIMDMNFYADNYSSLLRLPLPGYYFILLLGITGIILSYRKDNKMLLLYLFMLTYILSVIIFFVVGRFRVGMAPVLIIFTGYALISLYDIIRAGEYKKLIKPSAAVLLLTSINFSFIPEFSFSEYDAYIAIGNSYFEKQDYDRALENYLTSLDLREESGTFVLIGNTLAVRKDIRGAFNSYKRALEINPSNPMAHFHIGSLFVQTGNYKRAMSAFEATIIIDSTFADAYRNIAIIHYMHENYAESLLFFEKYLYLSKDEEAKVFVRRDIEDLKRKLKVDN